MPYLVVEDLKSGVDRRRKQIAGTPGSLWEGINGHISRGGDFEKRKAFVSTYALPAAQTFGLFAIGGNLYTFGSDASPSVPSGVLYQQLAHPTAQAMTRLITAEPNAGQIYAIAEYANGDIYHFYNGARVTSWDALAASVSSNSGVATALALRIDAASAYTATSLGADVTVTASVPGTAFATTGTAATNFGAVNDQLITVTPVIANVAETVSTGTVTITGGTAGAGNYLSSVTVNGVEILGANVLWTTSHDATAALVAARINSFTSSPQYTAAAVGAVVTISAAAGLGDSPNGFVVARTVAGTVTATVGNMASGVDGVAQVTKFTISGTFEAADSFTIALGGVDFTITGASAGTGITAKTFKNKLYSTASSLVYFGATGNPTIFGTGGVGAGFLDPSVTSGGVSPLTAIGKQQGNLGFFARNSIQIWSIDEDEDLNVFLQELENTGTVSPAAVVGFGNNDLFYLSDSGIRSVRAREASNVAFVSDPGNAIDPLVIETMDGLTETQIQRAVGVIEPVDGRLMIALGETIFVFSYFPGAKVSAWTTYEPGFEISAFAVLDNRLYARSGDTVYLYGGAANATYDSCEVTVTFPFLTGKKPGTKKKLTGYDTACENEWTVEMLVDPNNTARKTRLGIVPETTYMGKLPGASLESTHFAPRMTCTAVGYASISSVALHYELLGDADTGEGDS